jgi:hypothetical protein
MTTRAMELNVIDQEQPDEEELANIDHYNPVTVTVSGKEVTGILALTAIALILLFALLRAQERIRDLQAQLAGKVAAKQAGE